MRTYVSFLSMSDISLNIMPSSFIHGVVNGRISFFPWLNDNPVCMCVCVRVCEWHFLYPFIHWWTHMLFPGHCNNAVVNMGAQISFWSWWFYFLWIHTQKWDTWILWHFCLNFLGNLCTILVHSGCPNLHYHEQCIKWKCKSLSHAQLFATPWTI